MAAACNYARVIRLRPAGGPVRQIIAVAPGCFAVGTHDNGSADRYKLEPAFPGTVEPLAAVDTNGVVDASPGIYPLTNGGSDATR
jgi:hypothetical protein